MTEDFAPFKRCIAHAVYPDEDMICAGIYYWNEFIEGPGRWERHSIVIRMTVEDAKRFVKAIHDKEYAIVPENHEESDLIPTLEVCPGNGDPYLIWSDYIDSYEEGDIFILMVAKDMERVLKHMGAERCRPWHLPCAAYSKPSPTT